MAAQTYVQRMKRSLPGGLTELVISVVNVTAGDTISLATDLTKVQNAVIIADTKVAPGTFTTPAFAGSTVTVPAGYANDDMDLAVLGPAATT